ncbi:MAG: Dph6-related ATP pyrophosphatase [Candidatus Cryosericum sp.]
MMGSTESETMRAGLPFFCSWSGGKDCCLAFELAVEAGARPAALLTMMDETGERSHSHGLTRSSLQAQADAMRLPLLVRSASWAEYEETFVDGLQEVRRLGIADGVFGDMRVEAHPEWIAHREWVERVSARVGITPHFPLWDLYGAAVLQSQLDHGIEAVIIMTRNVALDRSFLGRQLDEACIADLRAVGCDPTGEGGEIHTVTRKAPCFAYPLAMTVGAVTEHSDCCFLAVQLERA